MENQEKTIIQLSKKIAKKQDFANLKKAEYNTATAEVKALTNQLTDLTKEQFMDKFASEGKQSGTVSISNENFKYKAKIDSVFIINEENINQLPKKLIEKVFKFKPSFLKSAFNELSVEDQNLIMQTHAVNQQFKELDIKVEAK